MREDIFKGISEELINKAKACKSPEEIFALAKEEGIELTEEQLEAVNGGYCKKTDKYQCPECGQHIKVISIKDFVDLETGLAKIGADDVEKVAEKYFGNISGIYKNRLDKLTGNENYIAGQMELSDFIS